jgi:hypothetical protein
MQLAMVSRVRSLANMSPDMHHARHMAYTACLRRLNGMERVENRLSIDLTSNRRAERRDRGLRGRKPVSVRAVVYVSCMVFCHLSGVNTSGRVDARTL